MNNDTAPLTKFLLPIDSDGTYERTTRVAGCLAEILGDRVTGISLVHVMAGSYLSQHMANIDFRVDTVLDSDTFKRLKAQYIEKTVRPILNDAEEGLKRLNVKAPVEQIIVDGDPVDKISEITVDGGFSTIIMERRGLSKVQEVFLSSVTAGLLHRNLDAAFYLAGKSASEEAACSVSRCLIAVDGSPQSLKAVREAGTLAGCCGEGMEEIVLLNVVELAHYEERATEGISPEKEAKESLDEAERILAECGVSGSKITQVARYGKPADVISEEAEERASNIIFVGRRGRSALTEVFMGSVSRGVIYRCVKPTVAVVA